jgi:valyl-tRNA synthetase
MDKTYSPQTIEASIYEKWERSGAFSPTEKPETEPFTIIMPPPNANDPLHVGHAMFITLQDILIRFHRMQGKSTLWLPGVDHAGIETQFVFEKKLKKEGKSRFDFDRDTLFTMIWEYVQQNKDVAVSQMKKIGASADWSRFTFTLDPKVVDIVLQTFLTLQQRGLIYRDSRLINYCTRCGTGYSELEVEYTTKKDPFVYITYGPFTIGTVRPETKFRDTALAVNPNDPRYKNVIGKTFEIMGVLGPITMVVVADENVDPEFGTGIMKVTPAHDFHDFELGKTHNLPVTPIIDLQGKMDFSWFLEDPEFKNKPAKYQERARMYHGLHVTKARPLIIEHLKEDGLLQKIDDQYEHNVGTCYRCGTVLEPLPLPQYFLRVETMKKKALDAINENKINIHGPGYDKILIHWLEQLKDWNISRQIVWGIRIPVWYSVQRYPLLTITFITKSGEIKTGTISDLLHMHDLEEIRTGLQKLTAPIDAEYVVSTTAPGKEYLQETDTFDTWFSSGQWPFVTLQVHHPDDFKKYYPTQVMETAYDILIFWVMRMVMMGLEITNTVPFTHVYLHGLVRDEKGQKMSKSKGNVINPIDVIDKYGADALRMALVMSTAAGKDSNTGEEKIRGMRNFTNKIWNASRFILLNENQTHQTPASGDSEFYTHLDIVVQTVTRQLTNLQIGLAAESIYQEFWHWFCDEAIETNKQGTISYEALRKGLTTFLVLLHPFVPFVTEEIWNKIGGKDLLINYHWPNETVAKK